MNNKITIIMLILLVAIAVPSVNAEPQSISVLSVTNETQGQVADIYLEVRPGRGSVFIDSFPHSRLDTQASTRFAQQYACDLADINCETLDFFYVIRAPSSIIRGPSAGAALTVLTYGVLTDKELRTDVVMTGTINSGGFIGPVGGVPVKVLAAEDKGFSMVLVPAPMQYPIATNISVIEVRDVEEAIWYYTGEKIEEHYELEVPQSYYGQMEILATTLCKRANQLSNALEQENETFQEYIEQANHAMGRSHFYTAASRCFTANLGLQAEFLSNKEQEELRRIYRQLEIDIEEFEMPQAINSIADLEVTMIVAERITEARNRLAEEDYNNLSAENLAYSLERFNSAISWSSFFGVIPSQELKVSEEQLENSCRNKLEEAEERLSYLGETASIQLTSNREELADAYTDAKNKNYESCVFKAAKVKAEANSVLSALHSGSQLNQSIMLRLQKAEDVIARQTAKGSFPILSYSYAEYAGDLEEIYSKNLYAEYSLEFANLDIYFPKERPNTPIDQDKLLLLALGIIIGFTAGYLAKGIQKHQKRRRKSKR